MQQEITDLQIALERKRSEISNLVVGYRRSIEGLGPIPADPLRRNLIETRQELNAMEARLAELQAVLIATPEAGPQANSGSH